MLRLLFGKQKKLVISSLVITKDHKILTDKILCIKVSTFLRTYQNVQLLRYFHVQVLVTDIPVSAFPIAQKWTRESGYKHLKPQSMKHYLTT